jgi:hypothetical protein
LSSTQSVEISQRSRSRAQGLIFVAAMVAVFGVAYAPERAWPNLLLNGFYVASLAVSAIFFLAAQRLTGARWSASLRRIPEAFALVMPVAAALMLLVLFGLHTLYPWSREGSFAGAPAIAGRVQYLQVSWMWVRVTVALFLWIVFAWLFRKASLEQDRNPRKSLLLHHRLTLYAALFVPIFAITFSSSVFDWLLSLDSQWFSTMFAVYAFAGTFVQGIAAVTLATILLKERGVLRGAVSEHQLHDLGKMLFAFSTFWAYIWTCQYLLIWYGNIPDEITHYLKRTNGAWLILFALNLVLNWIVPFTILLSVRAKRSRRVLKAVCILLLVGHWLDLYLLIMPSLWSRPKIGPFEIAIAAGYLALLYLVFVRNLSRAPLVPVHDPVLASERPALVHRTIRIRTRLSGMEQQQ